MNELTFDELFERLRTHDESLEIEAKRASDIGKSVMETVCAFDNEPGRPRNGSLCSGTVN